MTTKFPVATQNLTPEQRAERLTNREITDLIRSHDELVAALRAMLAEGQLIDRQYREAAKTMARAALAKLEGNDTFDSTELSREAGNPFGKPYREGR